MATRTPKGPVAAATPKKAPAKPASVPPAENKAAPAAVKIEPPEAAVKIEPPEAAVKIEPPEPAPAPVETPVAHAVEEVAPAVAPVEPAPVEPPPAVAPPAPVVAAAPAASPAIPKKVAKPAAPKAVPVPAAASIQTPATPVDQAIAQTKEKVEKMSKQVFATFEDVVGFQKDNVEAFVASSTILTKGFEALSKEIAAFTQAQYEQSVSATKALFAVKSVKELVDLQTEFAKTSFDALVAEATKVSEAGFKLTNEAAEPITARVNATVEKLSKLKAA